MAVVSIGAVGSCDCSSVSRSVINVELVEALTLSGEVLDVAVDDALDDASFDLAVGADWKMELILIRSPILILCKKSRYACMSSPEVVPVLATSGRDST